MEMLNCFPAPLRRELAQMHDGILCDIRLFVNRPCSIRTLQGERVAEFIPDSRTLYETAQALCERRLRLSPETTGTGFITLRGGHRMGLCGRITQDGKHLTLREVGSVCIRMAHEVAGCGQQVAACVRDADCLHGVLIAGTPGSGKTTMLRDAVRMLSESGVPIGLCDERGEIAACLGGVPQLDVGWRTHVLDGCPKQEGLRWLLRAMCPSLLAMDELYGEEECLVVREAAACGVPVVTTVHAGNARELCARRGIRLLLEEGVFSQVLFLHERRVLLQSSAKEVLEAAWRAR